MNGNPRVSAYTLQKAILTVFQDLKLYPAGIYSDIPAVQSWALKYGVAIKKLVLRRVHPYIGLILINWIPVLADHLYQGLVEIGSKAKCNGISIFTAIGT